MLLSSVSAWKFASHLLTARIAYDILLKESPVTIVDVKHILDILEVDFPTWTDKEGNYSFVECATFADDIKTTIGSFQQSWHFVNIPYLDEGGKLSDYNFTVPAMNSTDAITAIVDWIKKTPGYDQSLYYQQMV